MTRLFAFVVVAIVAGCATVTKVDQGEQLVGERLTVKLEGPWNRFERMAAFPVPTWTVEGITVDRLQFFVGVKNGAALAPPLPGLQGQRPLEFRSAMQSHEVVALFQSMLAADGSTFTLDRLDPVPFLGGTGFRFQFTVVRRVDEVRLSGVGYARISDGELHAILYQAPRLGFYPRYARQIEQMAATAGLRR